MGVWLNRYETLVNNDTLTLEKMKLFVGRNHYKAREFKINLLTHLQNEGIKLYSNDHIPTELFLEYLGRDMKYYETKMLQEAKINKIKGG